MESKLQNSSKHGVGDPVWFTVEKSCPRNRSLAHGAEPSLGSCCWQDYLTPQLDLVIVEEKVLKAAGGDIRVRWRNLVSLTVKWVFLSFVRSPESRDDSLGNCKIRMWLLTKSCGSLIALFIANQIISLDMHRQALIAYEITPLLHRNQLSFWGQLRCHLNPRIKKEEKKKKEKKPIHFNVLLSNRICGGNNLGMKEWAFPREQVISGKTSGMSKCHRGGKLQFFCPPLINNSN